MYPVTQAFSTALAASHRIATLAEVLTAGVVVAELDITDAQVTVDSVAAIRRQATLTVAGDDLVPADPDALLAPYGNELRLWRGIRLTGGDELIPLGVFQLDSAAVDDQPATLTTKVTAYDRAIAVQRNRWTAPYTMAAGTNVATAIRDALLDRLPILTVDDFDFALVEDTLPTDVVLGTSGSNDPWADLTARATDIGHELFFGPTGRPTLQPIPDVASADVVAALIEGAAGPLTLGRTRARAGTYSGVIITGEGPDVPTPVRAEAWDLDPDSPTYALGPFGRVPYQPSPSNFITTVEQAQAVADAELRRRTGLAEQIRLTSIVNPALDAGDVVTITRARTGVDADYVLQALTIPLDASQAMTVTTRQRTTG